MTTGSSDDRRGAATRGDAGYVSDPYRVASSRSKTPRSSRSGLPQVNTRAADPSDPSR